MFRIALGSFGLLALASPVSSQSFNVDFGPTAVPAPSHGGSANSPGFWNQIGASGSMNLADLSGTPTSVQLASPWAPWAGDCGGSGATGDEAAVFEDTVYAPNAMSWQFSGLVPGRYSVDTIVQAECTNLEAIGVAVAEADESYQSLYGWWPGSYHYLVNYTRHHVASFDGTVSVYADSAFGEYAHMSGIQLVFVAPLQGTSICFGDGSQAACPCGNNGQAGRGCENSIGTGGSLLFATGQTSPDSVVLEARYELPSSLSIVLQGNTVIVPVAYGDGLRCAGGLLKRLYVKSASSGEVVAPGPNDPSITARSAALGDPILPGTDRLYQVYYRDANPTFCPAPFGNTFNASHAVRITW